MNKVTSENVHRDLDRYLDEESTQEELALLKEYFGNADSLPADLLPYVQMFALIEERQPMPTVEALNRFSEEWMPVPRRHSLLRPQLQQYDHWYQSGVLKIVDFLCMNRNSEKT